MPFAVQTIAVATPEEIEREVANAAATVIAALAFKPGDRVRILDRGLIERIPLLSEIGIVTGFLPSSGGILSVMCAWGTGVENELQLTANAVALAH